MADARSDEAASEIVESVVFSFYTAEEVRRISVKKITNSESLDVKNSAVPDGLYDPALGPINDSDTCKTCGQLSFRCPGHYGHIELARPLYNPLLFRSLQNFLKATCSLCHKLKLGSKKLERYVKQLELIAKGDVVAARDMEDRTWGDVLFHEEDVADSDSNFSGGSATSAKGTTWSSLQYTEAIKVLNTVAAAKLKKCDNCGKTPPRIISPTFGWLNKVIRDYDLRANIMREYDPEAETSTISQSGNDSAAETEEHPQEKAKQKRKDDLVAKFVEQLSSSGQQHMFPTEVEHILKNLWKNEADFCTIMCDIQQRNLSLSERSKGYTKFFLKSLLVPPSKFRPPIHSSRGVTDHPQNILLRKVIESNMALQKCIDDNSGHSNIVRQWMELQRSVNVLFDSSKGLVKSEKDTPGTRQLLEKKAGILRQKMMGKRVNFACRSVISPDPYLAVNEIGIPPYFATRLTYPERVTPWNADRLRHAVINGADIHPGATHYKDRQKMYKLQASRAVRNAISRKLPVISGVLSHQGKGPETELEGKVVYRHLQDGDIVLVNRQPTLHKPSMMAHVVRVLKGEKTIRMHYANCSTYNADFDGDEMNVHLPQDEISRSEAINIVNANKQYIVPTSGEPIRGLIQDHIIGAVLLTKADTFLTREDYHQLLYACLPPSTCRKSSGIMVSLDDKIQPLPPTIWKPTPLWTGKQVLSAILNYITRDCERFNVEKEVRIPKEYISCSDRKLKLKICNNELIDGIMDKNQFGKFGLVHIVHELYGPDVAGTLMSILSRLFTSYLQMHGFTCGTDDLLLVQNADAERKRILEKSEEQSEDVHVRFCGIKGGHRDPAKLQTEIEKVLRNNGETGTARLDRMMSNAMNALTSEVNQALFPKGFMKPFPKNCLSLMTTTGAKGGLVNMTQISSLLGQQELEGKRVPRMASGKTLPCFPSWDFSSRAGGFISDRFLTGLRPQEYYFHCMAGRDGLVDTAIKTSRSGYLQRCLVKNLECLKVSYDYTVRDADGSVVQFAYGEDGIDVLKTSSISEFKILAENEKVVLQKFSNESEHAHLTKPNSYIRKLPPLLRDRATEFVRKWENQNGPQISIKKLTNLLTLKYFSSLAEPGESVGVIAAQSVGEPSTQMTLNTFHLAGKGEMNVTLGIPRLQEILMTASQHIRTPVMTCPLADGKNKEDAERIAAGLRRVTVADVVEDMEVHTIPFYVSGNRISTLYKLIIKLYPSELYPPHSELTTEDCLHVLMSVFVDAMEDSISRHLDISRRIGDISSVGRQVESENTPEEKTEEDVERNKLAEEDVDEHDDDDNGADDHGTDAEKRRKQATDEVEYDDDLEIEKSAVQEDGREPESGFESEIDQAAKEDGDEDYLIGGTNPESDSDDASPESPSKSEVTVDEKKPKSVKIGKKNAESGSRSKPASKKRKKVRRTVFVEAKGLRFEVHYLFRKEPHILLAEIAQKTAKSVYVKSSENIENCSVCEQKNNNNCFELQTAGVNFLTFWQLYEYLDVNRIYSNDVQSMLNTYGVEAARETIIREVNNVFKAYGIQVNIRHLNLIADFMTSYGGYRPMNRIGMSGFSTSPFGKMTFETATKCIVESALHGENDVLESPSARVCLGQPIKMGTGCFDLMQNLTK